MPHIWITHHLKDLFSMLGLGFKSIVWCFANCGSWWKCGYFSLHRSTTILFHRFFFFLIDVSHFPNLEVGLHSSYKNQNLSPLRCKILKFVTSISTSLNITYTILWGFWLLIVAMSFSFYLSSPFQMVIR